MDGGLSLEECRDRYQSARAGKLALLELGAQAIPQVRAWLKRWCLGLAQADVETIAERSFDIAAEKILGIHEWRQFLTYLGKTAFSIARKRFSNFLFASRRAASGSMLRWRARLTTANRRSPISSNMRG